MKTKALFLIIVFTVNSLVGFACAVRMGSIAASFGRCSCHRHRHKFGEERSSNKKSVGDNLSLRSEQGHSCPGMASNINSVLKIMPSVEKSRVYTSPVSFSFPTSFSPQPRVSSKPAFCNIAFARKGPPGKMIRLAIRSFQI